MLEFKVMRSKCDAGLIYDHTSVLPQAPLALRELLMNTFVFLEGVDLHAGVFSMLLNQGCFKEEYGPDHGAVTLPRDSSVLRHVSFLSCRKQAALVGLSSVFRLRLSLHALYEHYFPENKHMGIHTNLIVEPQMAQESFSVQGSVG